MLDQINRAAHVAVGVLAVLATRIPQGWAVTLAMVFLFWRYEVNEENALLIEQGRFDSAYEELKECLIGMSGAVLALLIH